MHNAGPLGYSGMLRILLKPNKTVHRQLHEPRVNKEQFSIFLGQGGGGEGRFHGFLENPLGPTG